MSFHYGHAQRRRTRGRPKGDLLARMMETAESPRFKAETRMLVEKECSRLGIPLREFSEPSRHDTEEQVRRLQRTWWGPWFDSVMGESV